jgi:hypothetical protein
MSAVWMTPNVSATANSPLLTPTAKGHVRNMLVEFIAGRLSSGSQSLKGCEVCSFAALIVQDRATRWSREVCEQSSSYLADMKDSLIFSWRSEVSALCCIHSISDNTVSFSSYAIQPYSVLLLVAFSESIDWISKCDVQERKHLSHAV